MEFGKLAESFDALKKKQRIETLLLAVEENLNPTRIAERVNLSDSTVRKYLRDFEDAGIVEKTGDGYEYTEYGERLRASIELFTYEQEMEWLKQKQRRAEKLRDEMKAQRKKMFKQKLLNLV